jgi:surface polysaccharide O-acyltransferase-like enzyme
MFSGKKNNFGASTIYLSILRIIAIFLVVLLHASANTVIKYRSIGTGSWMVSNLFDSITRPSVAIFFMVSGALLLTKDEPSDIFYKKRFIKILIPYYFWQLFYLFYSVSFQIEPLFAALRLADTYYKFIFGSMSDHLWFVPVLIQIYLITPMLRQWILNTKKSQVLLSIAIWGAVIATNDLVFYIFGKSIVTSDFIFGLGYFLLGYYLSTYKHKFNLKSIVMMLILSLGTTAFLTGMITITNNELFLHPYKYSSISNCIAAASLFILLKQINWTKTLSNYSIKIVLYSSSLCFGIYLVHFFVLEMITKGFSSILFTQGSKWYDFLVEIPILAAATFVGSYMIVSVLKAIKISKIFV